MVDAKTVRTAQSAGIGLALVAAVVVVGYLLYRIIKPVGNAAEALAGGVEDVAQGAGRVGQGAGSVLQGTGNILDVAGGFFRNEQGANVDAPRAGEFNETNRNLRIQVVSKDDDNSKTKKTTTVVLRATDSDTGAPVPFVEWTAVPHFAAAQITLAGGVGKSIQRVGDARGYLRMFWTVGNVAFTDGEDDMTFTARKAGYNPSRITVK